MDSASVPASRIADPARLRTLIETGLLEPEEYPALDRLTRMAAGQVHAPTALVSLVNIDEQVFASHVGLGEPLASAGRTPLSYSFCKHVVADDAPLVVTDARIDDRVADNRAVVELGVVAYAGYPLHAPDGQVLGSFCVVDSEPRDWSPAELTLLQELAGAAESEIALRLLNRELLLTSTRMQSVLDTASDAFVSIDAAGLVTAWNTAAEQLFGFPYEEAVGRALSQLIIPERLRAAHDTGVARIHAGAEPTVAGQRLELPAVDRTGQEFPIELTVQVVREDDQVVSHAFLHDISDRKAAQQLLENERTFLQALLDSLDAGVAACDADGRLTLFNRALREIHQDRARPIDVAQWADAYRLHGPDGHTPLRADEVPLARAFAGQQVDRQHIVVDTPGRRPRRFLANGRPIDTRDGRRLGAVVAMHDITEQHRAETLREAQLAVAGALAEAADAATATVAGVARALGWTAGEYWHADPDTDTLTRVARWATTDDGTTDDGTTDDGTTDDGTAAVSARRGEGTVGTVWSTGQELWLPDTRPGSGTDTGGPRTAIGLPVRSDDLVLGVLLFHTTTHEERGGDLSAMLDGVCAHLGRHLERRRAEELARDLAAARRDFDRVISQVNDYVWTVEVQPGGAIRSVYASPDGSGVFGQHLPAGTDLVATMTHRVHPDDLDTLDAFYAALADGHPSDVELRINGVDGVIRWVWMRGAVRFEGARVFIDGISTNVTERRHLAEQREQLLGEQQHQVRKLQELDRMKDELVALVSHELRNPLGAIRGYTEMLLEDSSFDGENHAYVAVIHKHSAHMQSLVDDLLDLARLEADGMSIDARPVALARLVRETVEAQHPAADAKGLVIDVRMPKHLPVHADPTRLRQVLDNLLSNAVKYTPAGGRVRIEARPAQPPQEHAAVVVSVTDSGIGIPAEQYPQLFHRFFRATNAVSQGIKGTGLGLTICKAIMDAHHGTITARPAETATGTGTTFTITLPGAPVS